MIKDMTIRHRLFGVEVMLKTGLGVPDKPVALQRSPKVFGRVTANAIPIFFFEDEHSRESWLKFRPQEVFVPPVQVLRAHANG